MARFLITGGFGYIGSQLIRRIPAHHTVTVVDSMRSQRYESMRRIGRAVRFAEIPFQNLTDEEIRQHDVIVHLAAITNAPSSFERRDEVQRVNVTDTIQFFERAANLRVRRIVFPSSTSVYGVATDIVKEGDGDTDVNPQSPYAESKYAVEKILRAWTGVEWCVLRLGTVFGHSPGIRYDTAVNKFCYQAAFGRPLTVWRQNISHVRPYLSVDDAARSLLHAATMDGCNNIFNVLTINASLEAVLALVQDVTPVTVDWVDTPLLNQYTYRVDDARFRGTGFLPESSDALGPSIRELVGGLRHAV